MSTLDIEEKRKKHGKKTALIYFLIAIFCGIFSFIYESFSHGVLSWYMVLLFVYPLVGGTIVFLLLSFIKIIPYPNRLVYNIYNSLIATLTVGSAVKGVLEIYGTKSDLSMVYPCVCIILLIGILVTYTRQCLKEKREKNEKTE